MSALTDRMQQIEENKAATYYSRLLSSCGGGTQSAATVDLAIDGNYWRVDLRRAPFAGDEHLKELYRAAVAAQRELSDALLDRVWEAPLSP